MSRLAMLVPSRGRPENIRRLADTMSIVTSTSTALVVVVDGDDPCREEYERNQVKEGGYSLMHAPADIRRLGPILNWAAGTFASYFDYVGFMGDDHAPRTKNWDLQLMSELELTGKPGVAYGNDLLQGANLPTACIVSSVIVRALGYMVPPGLEHLYLDDFWKRLGQETRLEYRDDVIIEHMHPVAKKGQWDEGYATANSPAQYNADEAKWKSFLADRWPDDLSKLKVILNG